MKRIRKAKLFVFLRTHRHELLNRAFQDELASQYRQTERGRPPVAPAILALAVILQAYAGASDDEAILLDYFQDDALRRRILIGLNKREALHALTRQLFSGKHGELWDRAFEDQMHRASCLHLIMAAIAAWNAVYLSQAVEELKKRGEAVPEEYLPRVTPLGWGHINLIGQYSFIHQSAINVLPSGVREYST